MTRDQIAELINRRRRQVLVHSFLYYRMNTSLISDHTFDEWAKELADLQAKYPDIAAECVYAKDFEGFDGSSGYDLPLYGWAEHKARKLLWYAERRKVSKDL